ncbi:serine hydrolase domain-containing protein [Paucibacter sp. Y2R2-4]|uniref:serine hydrolase domain-containing protein n=1 Tax=Paucibacter sp. Y2R2-4 TaxID=2893553 RepID=UPI0021E3C5C9|nr:serine hydrolase domain-containing protein [Paucibacter sp. Y2R2-4]MCV2351891.1 beta-lactamase family protein [Paucibacter sp. Y2R2-4]
MLSASSKIKFRAAPGATSAVLAAIAGLGIALCAPQQALAGPLPAAADVAAYAERLMDEQKLGREGPGVALLVARGDQLLYKGARGMASIELGVPLSAEQSFRIGSVTKQFGAAALLKLVDEGRAKLEDPLSKYLPSYPGGDKITLAQLLNHSSGIKSYTGIPGYMHNPIRRELSTEQLVAEFKDQSVDFAPGQSWAYNNSGYVLVGAVVEAISGKPWHQYIDEALLRPQKISSVRYPGENLLIKGMVQGYSGEASSGYTVAGLLSMTQPHAAGALVSDVEGLWRWNQALHGGKLISAESYKRMTTPEGAAIKSPMHYGYGLGVDSLRGQLMLQHGGGIHGFVSTLNYLPSSKTTVVALRNSDGPGLAMDLLVRKLGAFAIGEAYPELKPVQVSAAELSAAEGVYSLDAKTSRSLRVQGGVLTSTRSGGRPLNLIPLGHDQFAFENSVARLKIERGTDGKATGLRFFNDGDGVGEAWARSGELPAVHASVSLTPEQQQALLGDYASPQLQVKIFLGPQAQLMGQVPGQSAMELKASGPRSLLVQGVDAKLEFSAEAAAAQEVTLLQGPARITMKRR